MSMMAGCSLPISKLDIRPAIWSRTWFADYPSARAHAEQNKQPLLIYFKETEPWTDDPVENSLKGEALSVRTGNFVRVVLLRSYEPDRRVVRQFGVARAPAVVLVHADGTFHAVSGDLSGDRLDRFFDSATPPGERPVPDLFPSHGAELAWETSLEEALVRGRETSREVFVVLDRPWTRDWERLSPLVNRHEVRSRVAEMVHCRPMPIWKFGTGYVERFSLTNLPAIVVVRPDGHFRSLEIPNSYEAIVRFLDASESGVRSTLDSSADTRAPGGT